MLRGYHQSSILRLYAKWKKGRRVVVSIRTIILNETTKIHKYIKKLAIMIACLVHQKPETQEVLEEGPQWKDRHLLLKNLTNDRTMTKRHHRGTNYVSMGTNFKHNSVQLT